MLECCTARGDQFGREERSWVHGAEDQVVVRQ